MQALLEEWKNTLNAMGRDGAGQSPHPEPSAVDGRASAPGCTPSTGQIPRLFSGVPENDYKLISAAARVKEFARGEVLYLEDEPVQRVLLLTSGIVKINKLAAGGEEVILRLDVPGEVVGATDLLTGGTHRTTAQAFRRCRALIWDVAAFRSLAKRIPVLHENMLRILTDYLLELEERFRELATERVGPRVARQLVRLHSKIGRSVDGDVEIGLSREELAQMTGTTLFTVSRLLSAWESCGAVKPGREAVTVCDLRTLRALSEGNEPCATQCPWLVPGHAAAIPQESPCHFATEETVSSLGGAGLLNCRTKSNRARAVAAGERAAYRVGVAPAQGPRLRSRSSIE